MKTNPIRLLLAAALLAPCALLADIVDPADYAKSFDIKFSGYAGNTTLENFPALIRLSAARNAFDYSKCKIADGGDTRFFDANGNLLPCEVDTWNPDGESLIWVSVPELTKDTTITVRYGNANAPAVMSTDVWTNGYVAVWHMSAAEGTFTQTDSTTTGKNIAPNASYRAGILCGVEGTVGKAAELGRDGATTGAFYVSDSDGSLDGFPAMTLEAWTYQTAYASYDTYLFNKLVPSPQVDAYKFYQRKDTSGRIAAYFYKTDGGNGDIWQGNTYDGAQLNEWTHQVARWSGATGRRSGFINGVRVYNATADGAKGTGKHAGTGSSLYIGNRLADQWGKSAFPGKIDEVRISSVARSDDWVVASHDTIANDRFAVFEVPNDWTQYAHKFSVAFPGVEEGATLENFPVLVKVSEAGIPGFHYADCAKEDGADLRFSDANGTLLPCEVEVWNPEGESLVWVKVPSLAKGTRITCYYGWNLAPAVEATEVWDANYLAVWHMDAASDSLSQPDATANNRTVTLPSDDADNVNPGVVGIVGAAADFGHRADGKGNYGRSNADGTFDGLTTATFEFWTKQEVTPTNNNSYVIYCGQASPTVNAYSLYQPKGGSTAAAYYTDARKYVWGGSAATPLGSWNHHAFRYDGINGKTSYIQNNVSKYDEPKPDANGHTIDAVKNQLCIGSFTTIYTANANYMGKLDEVRISNVVRSDAWILATHDTIAENATFTTYGAAHANIRGTVVFLR